MYRFFDRSRDNMSRGRDFGRDSLGLRDGSEMVVSDVCVKGKKTKSFLSSNIFFTFFLLHLFLFDSSEFFSFV